MDVWSDLQSWTNMTMKQLKYCVKAQQKETSRYPVMLHDVEDITTAFDVKPEESVVPEHIQRALFDQKIGDFQVKKYHYNIHLKEDKIPS